MCDYPKTKKACAEVAKMYMAGHATKTSAAAAAGITRQSLGAIINWESPRWASMRLIEKIAFDAGIKE